MVRRSDGDVVVVGKGDFTEREHLFRMKQRMWRFGKCRQGLFLVSYYTSREIFWLVWRELVVTDWLAETSG
jgi:hypothetical protein